MRIGELAERTGVSRRMLRHYEQYGLLAAARGPNGWRRYDETAVHRVRLIAEMTSSGLTLDGVKQLAACLDVHDPSDCDDGGLALRTYQARLEVLEDRLTQLQENHDRLTRQIQWLQRHGRSTTSPVPSTSRPPHHP